MKYRGHILKKVLDVDVDGGSYYEIYYNDKYITSAWTLENAKEFVYSKDVPSNNGNYNWNVLC